MKRVAALWYTGHGKHEVKTIAISNTKLVPPPGTKLPDDIGDLHESLLHRPAPVTQRQGEQGRQVAAAAVDPLRRVTMSQEFELPTDDLFRSIPSPPPTPTVDAPTEGRKIKANETYWEEDDGATKMQVNGPPSNRTWLVKDAVGNSYGARSDLHAVNTPMDYWLLMFPPKALTHTLHQTNRCLKKRGVGETDMEELIKFFGVLILCTRFEFTSRGSLWSGESYTRFHHSPNLGCTGMSRNRFDALWSNMRFSYQPWERPEYQSSENYRWDLVGDFIRFFNEHRWKQFQPSSTICVDESISRWYGMGGDWINEGLPMYVQIDRKPENGAEIQNACCAESGVMLRLRIRKTATHDRQGHDTETGHSTAILKELVSPWARSGRVVVADSFYASVEAARELFKIGLRFVGVVKIVTRQFPMAALGRVQFQGRGEWKGLIHKSTDDGLPDLLAFTWVDTNRRFFISSVSSLLPAPPIERTRLRQVNREENAAPEKVYLSIQQPEASALYYTAAAKIDQHNRTRQADLAIERKLGTHDWSKRVNMSIFGMIAVDAYLVWKQCTGSNDSPNCFFHKLAQEMIDYDLITRSERNAMAEAATDPLGVRPDLYTPAKRCLGPRLTPTKRRRTSPSDNGKCPFLHQNRCGRCVKRKTTWLCSLCRDLGKEHYLCKKDPECFAAHLEESHDVK
jgi:hypothetical protein